MLDRFNATGADDDAERRPILEELLAKFGPGAAITIGDDVRIGPRAQLLTALHPMEDHERRRAGWERPAPITIDENAWLGGGVIVCPGVTIGESAVIGAGSVVVRDIPDHVTRRG